MLIAFGFIVRVQKFLNSVILKPSQISIFVDEI